MYKTDKWELQHCPDEEQIEIIVREDKGGITNGFASIPCYGEDDVSYNDQWEIAHLLVAAPKLLATCKNLVKLLCHPGSFVSAKDIKNAKDVIAAATPEQAVEGD